MSFSAREKAESWQKKPQPPISLISVVLLMLRYCSFLSCRFYHSLLGKCPRFCLGNRMWARNGLYHLLPLSPLHRHTLTFISTAQSTTSPRQPVCSSASNVAATVIPAAAVAVYVTHASPICRCRGYLRLPLWAAAASAVLYGKNLMAWGSLASQRRWHWSSISSCIVDLWARQQLANIQPKQCSSPRPAPTMWPSRLGAVRPHSPRQSDRTALCYR